MKIRSEHIVKWTENCLTIRKAKKRITAEKNKKKGPVREWVEAILWAVVIVFIINQFIFQLYQIPSSSMENTLLIKDRVFVNKAIFGPEIYPDGPKILDFNDPKRDDIIIFQNPNYVSRGPVFDVMNRIIYMITLSLVNIDKDENGNPRAQLYVKRAVGYPGDTITFDQGNILIRPIGYRGSVDEETFRADAGLTVFHKRTFTDEDYTAFTAYAQMQAYEKEGIQVPVDLQKLANSSSSSLKDYYHIYKAYYTMRAKIDPQDDTVRSELTRYTNGFYLPAGYILPIGDNRDNSGDGRYFGPIPAKEMLGKAIFRFWPISRVGILH